MTYYQADGPTVDLNTETDSNVSVFFPDAHTVDLSPEGVFYSEGSTRVQVDQFGSDSSQTQLSNLDVGSTTLEADVSGQQRVGLKGGINSIDYSDVEIDSSTTDFTYQASESTTVTFYDVGSTTWYEAVDADTGMTLSTVQSSSTGAVTFELPDGTHDVEIQTADISVPEISNESPVDGGSVTSRTLNLSAQIADDDFPNDELNVEIYLEGDLVTNETLTQNGTVSTEITVDSGGDYNWSVNVSDSFGSQVSHSFQFSTPDTLYIRDELNPDELVDDEQFNMTASIYSEDLTIQEDVTDGKMSLTGLPLDQPIVITVEADNWNDRRILIRDITRQQNVYLLSEDAESVDMTFVLNDRTRNFPSQDSELYIQKSLAVGSDEFRWRTVSGDYFAADGRFETTLAYNDRYRIVIRNAEGDERILGSYIPTSPGPTTLDIGRIVWSPPEGQAVVFDANEIEEDGQEKLRLMYNDTEDATNQLDITVRNRKNNDIIFEATQYDVTSYSEIIPLTDNQSEMDLIVTAQADRDGDDFETTVQLGKLEELDLPIDDKWLRVFAQIFLVAIAGLVAGLISGGGAIIIVAFATALTWLGWIPIHPAALGLAGVIALLGALRSRYGGGV
ncbi:sulfite exporter TauE/SafE family protein [Natrinema sp. DC36]|uniref:sulfite exporter TauE/SafE family protein n=1 Tax=Natrinema sp. DC36 TaxID=2878680 RepID=UPI001CF08589|nr:sulfite exporter TauE/SafE family protein [Natrinema sp. DC36]